MLLSQIETRPVPADNLSSGKELVVLDEQTQELERRAAEELGFKNPAPNDEAVSKRPLANALKSLLWDEVLNEISVERYKEELILNAAVKADAVRKRMEKFLRKQQFCSNWKTVGYGRAILRQEILSNFLVQILLIVPMAFAFAGLVMAFAVPEESTGWIFVSASSLFLFAMSSPFLLLPYLRYKSFMRSTAKEEQAELEALEQEAEANPYMGWEVSEMPHYDLARIPNAVLEGALEVKKACPQASFFIHHTVVTWVPNRSAVTKELNRRHADPFLEVRFRDESYLIAVWDEKDYRVMKQSL